MSGKLYFSLEIPRIVELSDKVDYNLEFARNSCMDFEGRTKDRNYFGRSIIRDKVEVGFSASTDLLNTIPEYVYDL